MSATPRVSVIVPNLDAPAVDRTIDALARQEGARAHEIIVAGRDGPGRLRGDGRVRLVDSGGPRPPGAMRNLGVAVATGDLLAFVDADCEPEPGWLAAHLRRQAAGWSVVGGAVLWDDAPYWTMADNLSMFHAFGEGAPGGPRPFLPTLSLSVSRAAWEAAGGMDPVLRCGEDVDFTIRLAAAGHPAYFEPAARLWHRPPRSRARDLWAHAHRSGRWMVPVRRMHPEAFPAPGWLYRPWSLRLLAPAIAAAAAGRIYRRGGPGWRWPAALPAVYLSKIAWCLGGARPVDLSARRAASRGDRG